MNIAKLKLRMNDLLKNITQYKNSLSRIVVTKESNLILEKQLELDLLKFIQNLKNEIDKLEKEFIEK